jgi:hypothetical protein
MATRAQLDRLAQRIEGLAARTPRRVALVIHDPRLDHTQAAAISRYMADNPGDRDANALIVIKIVDPAPHG